MKGFRTGPHRLARGRRGPSLKGRPKLGQRCEFHQPFYALVGSCGDGVGENRQAREKRLGNSSQRTRASLLIADDRSHLRKQLIKVCVAQFA